MNKNFIETFNGKSINDSFLNLNRKVCAGLAVAALVAVMFNATGCTKDEVDDISVNLPQEEAVVKDTVKVGNDGENAAIASDDALPQTVKLEESKGSMVAMSVEDLGRSDPFLPSKEVAIMNQKAAEASHRKPNGDLLPPPEGLWVDNTAVNVVATKVSGIMYDKYNPSAILNISGADYLVRTGDVINNYKILSIGKENVTVQYGANIYKAGVGELFTGEGINYNTISNLQNKFGGSRNPINNKH